MKKDTFIVIADYSEETIFSFEELCETCHISSEFIKDLIEYDIIHPKDSHNESDEWAFDLVELQKIKTAIRLRHDLEVNLPGIAIVLELLKEVKELRTQNKLLEKHLLED